MKKLITILSLVALIAMVSAGVNYILTNESNEATVSQPETVSETFMITSIDSEGYVRGELTEGSGEGIYYHMDELTAHTDSIIKGDIITIEWLQSDYVNEVWDNIQSVHIEEDMNITLDCKVIDTEGDTLTVQSTLSNKTITFNKDNADFNTGDNVTVTFSPSYELLSVNNTTLN